jgi:hypothetical protein
VRWEHIAFADDDEVEGFLQIDVRRDTAGRVLDVPECRLFILFDQLQPATPADWAVWLDRGNGLIGAPDFQIDEDGRTLVYRRLWSPDSTTRIEPATLEEMLDRTVGGTYRNERRQAMLYARWLDRNAAGRDEGEFLLLSATASGRVDIHVGIALNPASLNFL